MKSSTATSVCNIETLREPSSPMHWVKRYSMDRSALPLIIDMLDGRGVVAPHDGRDFSELREVFGADVIFIACGPKSVLSCSGDIL